MRVLLAGATGVIGIRLRALLVDAAHEVPGMIRTPDKTAAIETLGASPFVSDVLDAGAAAGGRQLPRTGHLR